MTLEIQSVSGNLDVINCDFPENSSAFSASVWNELQQTVQAMIATQSSSIRTKAVQRLEAMPMIVEDEYRIHYLNSYSLFDRNIELEDGSFWEIVPSDMYKIINWASNDPLSLYPNHRLLGPEYIIQNDVTGEMVEARLLVGPIAFGTHTHWILSIDSWSHRIYLEDGSAWTVRNLDSIYEWTINDTIIVGDGRNEWFGHHDAVLINVNLNKYVYANRGI